MKWYKKIGFIGLLFIAFSSKSMREGPRPMHEQNDDTNEPKRPSGFSNFIDSFKQYFMRKPQQTPASSKPPVTLDSSTVNAEPTNTITIDTSDSSNNSLTPKEEIDLLEKLNDQKPAFYLDKKPDYDTKTNTERQTAFIKKLFADLEENPNYKITKDDLKGLTPEELNNIETITQGAKYSFAKYQKLSRLKKWQIKKMQQINEELQKTTPGSKEYRSLLWKKARLDILGF